MERMELRIDGMELEGFNNSDGSCSLAFTNASNGYSVYLDEQSIEGKATVQALCNKLKDTMRLLEDELKCSVGFNWKQLEDGTQYVGEW